MSYQEINQLVPDMPGQENDFAQPGCWNRSLNPLCHRRSRPRGPIVLWHSRSGYSQCSGRPHPHDRNDRQRF